MKMEPKILKKYQQGTFCIKRKNTIINKLTGSKRFKCKIQKISQGNFSRFMEHHKIQEMESITINEIEKIDRTFCRKKITK